MITRFRQSWKRNKIPLLIQTKDLILNITNLKRRSTISMYLSKTSHMIKSVLVFITLWREKGAPKLCNNLYLHQDNMTTAKKWSCKEVSKQMPDPCSPFCFPLPYFHQSFLPSPSPSQNYPPQTLSFPALPSFSSSSLCRWASFGLDCGWGGGWGGGGVGHYYLLRLKLAIVLSNISFNKKTEANNEPL